MSKLKFSITTSLDGYVAGPNQGAEHPVGEGGLRLHDWAISTKTFRTMHGETNDGETGINDDVLREAAGDVGATIMGRNMFGPVRGPWGENPWRGWWGDDPPFHHPVFVLTHHAREPLHLQGTTFHFVTDGIESALAQACRAAGGRDVAVGGGARTVQQYLAAGLLDELEIHCAPRARRRRTAARSPRRFQRETRIRPYAGGAGRCSSEVSRGQQSRAVRS